MEVKKVKEDAFLPRRGSEQAAGYDLYAYSGDREILTDDADIVIAEIKPGKTIRIGTGIAVAIPDGYCGLVLPRSGIATKQGLRPANTPGLIDSDYRGEVIVALHNDSDETRYVTRFERIAQLLIVPYFADEMEEVDDLDDTARGSGGFGSTGL